jgi:GNAT superfamily N-acetyltransferase
VRRATPADAAVVAEMLHAFNVEFETSTPPVEVLAERLSRLLAREDMVALIAGDPASGLALLTFRPGVWDTGPVTLLEELYVRPQLRGRGIGHELLERAIALARGRGSENFEINVDEGDTDAQRFYERHGFSNRDPDSGERAFYYFRAI